MKVLFSRLLDMRPLVRDFSNYRLELSSRISLFLSSYNFEITLFSELISATFDEIYLS